MHYYISYILLSLLRRLITSRYYRRSLHIIIVTNSETRRTVTINTVDCYKQDYLVLFVNLANNRTINKTALNKLLRQSRSS